MVLVFLGLIYAWSIFAAPLEAEFHWSRVQTSLTFSISMAFFCLGGLVSGLCARRINSHLLVLASGALIFTGFTLLSRVSSLPMLYLCYGVLAGLGVGVGYNTLMCLVVGWFPDHTGLLSGILLMGFGFGGSILGHIFDVGITLVGWRKTFSLSGAVMLAVACAAAMLLRQPEQARAAHSDVGVPPREMLRRRAFRSFYLWAILISSGGLALIGSAVPFAQSFTGDGAAAATMAGLISTANGVGRLLTGFALDHFGIPRTLQAISLGALLGAVVLFAATGLRSMPLLVLAFCLVGFFYGAVTPANSAYTSRAFGMEFYSINFSIVVTNLLFAAFLGPSVAGWLQGDGQYGSTSAFLVLLSSLALPAAHIASSAFKKTSVIK